MISITVLNEKMKRNYSCVRNNYFHQLAQFTEFQTMSYCQGPGHYLSRTWALLCLQTVILTNTLIMFTSSVLASQGGF